MPHAATREQQEANYEAYLEENRQAALRARDAFLADRKRAHQGRKVTVVTPEGLRKTEHRKPPDLETIGCITPPEIYE